MFCNLTKRNCFLPQSMGYMSTSHKIDIIKNCSNKPAFFGARFLSQASTGNEASCLKVKYVAPKSAEADEKHIAIVSLSAPTNSLGKSFWSEFKSTFKNLKENRQVRCIILRAEGKFFSVGLDLKDKELMKDLFGSPDKKEEIARKTLKLKELISDYQSTFTIMEHCPQPVICCVQGPCIGGAVDMILATDIRIASKQAWFSIKEVDIGLAADVGTLQRIEKLTGNSSLVRELAYTARNFTAEEALSFGMISKVLANQEELDKYAMELATQISLKSPIGIHGTKVNLNYSRDHTIDDSLNYMSTWNSLYIQAEDVEMTIQQSLNKKNNPLKYKNL